MSPAETVAVPAPKYPPPPPRRVAVVDVMIDLETLGTTPGSVVLSIGAVARGSSLSTNVADRFYARLNLRDSIYRGLKISSDTMSWWRKQTEEAWQESTSAVTPLRESLLAFAGWLLELRAGSAEAATGNKLRLWGDSASFDLGLLAAVFRAADVTVPWSYQEEFCYRTLRAIRGSEKPRAKLQHDALSDAAAQLEHLVLLLDETEVVR